MIPVVGLGNGGKANETYSQNNFYYQYCLNYYYLPGPEERRRQRHYSRTIVERNKYPPERDKASHHCGCTYARFMRRTMSLKYYKIKNERKSSYRCYIPFPVVKREAPFSSSCFSRLSCQRSLPSARLREWPWLFEDMTSVCCTRRP